MRSRSSASDDGEERDAVDDEHRAGAEDLDQQAGQRRADHAAEVERRAVEADRVGQVVRADHLHDEGLPGRVVERGAQTEQGREDEDVPDRDDAGEVEHAERDRDQAHERLGEDQQLALGVAVGEHPAPRAEEQHRQELQPGGDAERDAVVVGELDDQPVLGDALHPGADVRDHAPGVVDAVVAVAQRAERRAHRRVSRSITGAAARRTSRSSWVSSASRRASQASRRRRSSLSSACALGGQRDQVLAAVRLVGGAQDQPTLLEAGEDPGHRRRLHLLVLGELARGQRAVPVEGAEGRPAG